MKHSNIVILFGAAAVTAVSSTGLAQADACANATPLVVRRDGIVVHGQIAGATPDGGSSCTPTPWPDVWYAFTPSTECELVVDTCASVNSFNTVLSLHTGCPGTVANQVACNDDACSVFSGLAARVYAHRTYYLRVTGWAGAQGQFTLSASYQNGLPERTQGPDVFVADLTDTAFIGQASGIVAYSFGTNACNLGDTPVGWTAANNNHPVIAQNLFRLAEGRFEQIGQSWVKHGWASGNEQYCSVCTTPPGGTTQLGSGCSDTYTAVTNAAQGRLGPRSQVNGTSGVFAYPFSAPAAEPVIGRRLQVHSADVDPAQNSSARYFAEAHYLAPDDAMGSPGSQGNGLNNCTWREVRIESMLAAPAWVGTGHRFEPAIFAWAQADQQVMLSPVEYTEDGLTAQVWVGSRATGNADGTWTYEYVVYNHNSDRGVGRFVVPRPAGASVVSSRFHAPESHSGEPYENSAWPVAVKPGSVAWSTTAYQQSPNANAIRWGTLYNFSVTTSAPPGVGSVGVTLFKPPTPASPAVVLDVDGVVVPSRGACGSADFNHDGDAGTDADIQAFFLCLGGNCCPACDTADFNGDSDNGTDADIEAFFRVLAGGAC